MFARNPRNQKPYINNDELQPAAPMPCALSRHLAGPLWLAAGVALATVALGSPGCTATGGPVVSAKGEVSVKEVAHRVALANADRGNEMNASLVLELRWPTK